MIKGLKTEKSKKSTPATALAQGAALTALALIFSYVEFLIPISIAMPGIKLGLANIVVVVTLYTLGAGYGLFVNAARILLSALLFGNAFSALYALCGGLLSFAVMVALKRTRLFSIAGVSMAGGVFHNMGQLFVAAFIIESSQIFYYFPVLLLSGMATGIGIGILATYILRALGYARPVDGPSSAPEQ